MCTYPVYSLPFKSCIFSFKSWLLNHVIYHLNFPTFKVFFYGTLWIRKREKKKQAGSLPLNSIKKEDEDEENHHHHCKRHQ